MGKAKIISEAGDGKYTIKLDFGTELRDERVEDLTKRITEAKEKIAEAKAKHQEAEAAESAAKNAAKQATDDYIAATKAVPDAFKAVTKAGEDLADVYRQQNPTVKKVKDAEAVLKAAEADYKEAQKEVITKMAAQVDAAKKLVEAKKETAPLKLALDLLNDELKQLEKTKAYYAKLELEEEREAWCADLTEEAEGEVATIEIPGETKLILIKAGAEEGGSVDGQLMARELQSPAQVFFNAAILPGWQKWQPTYRTGSITKLDFEANTASVKLDAEKSSAQKLDINQTKTLEAVPVIYMGCHAEAFEVGDACIVRFDGMDWASPQVVGFVDNPKACPGGIGVQTDAGMFILRPPKDGQGQWQSRSVKELNGGVAYVSQGAHTLVESPYGLYRSNKVIDSALYGAKSAPQINTGELFPVSGLFIVDGVVKQAKAEGDVLQVTGRVIKNIPNGLAQSESYALPDTGKGDLWAMASAAQDGKSLLVCRIGIEDGVPPYFFGQLNGTCVSAAVQFTASEDAPGALTQNAVNILDGNVITRTPDSTGSGKEVAPEWSTYTDSGHKYSMSDEKVVSYNEVSGFESESIYRQYIGRDGAVVTDSVKRKSNLLVDGAYYGYGVKDSREYYSFADVSVQMEKSEEVIFFGKHLVKTRDSTLKFTRDYSSYTTNWDIHFEFNDSQTGVFNTEDAAILVADEQFDIVIAVKVSMHLSGGILSQSDPSSGYVENKSWPNSPISASLEIMGSTTQSIDLPIGNADVQEFAKLQMEYYMKGMAKPQFFSIKRAVKSDGVGNSSGFARNQWGVAQEDVVERDTRANLSDVQYVKDPKTGVGFLSFKWGEDTHNYVIGEWGALPSPSKTDIATGDKILKLVSI